MLFYTNLNKYIEQEIIKLSHLAEANLPEVAYITDLYGPNPHQDKENHFAQYSITQPVNHLEIDYQGIIGDRHRRLIRPTTGREKAIYPKQTQIRGFRHVFIVSRYDCELLSQKLGISITPQLLGANIVIDRLDKKDFSLSQLPHGTYLVIAPEDAVEAPKPPLAVLIHFAKQKGCGITGNAIADFYGDKKLAKSFVAHSANNRGIVCGIQFPANMTATLKLKLKIFFKYPTGLTP